MTSTNKACLKPLFERLIYAFAGTNSGPISKGQALAWRCERGGKFRGLDWIGAWDCRQKGENAARGKLNLPGGSVRSGPMEW